MLGEIFDEESDSNINDLFKKKPEQNLNNNMNFNDLLEFPSNKSGEEKKEKPKKKKKKAICENCKALIQKINELEQLNIELLKIKEKLSQENESLSQKNEELNQNNINIINKNQELITINKKLKEENNELINKNKELNEENNKIKKQIISNQNKSNNKEEINKKPIENQNINISTNKNEIKNNTNINIQNNESIIPNKDIIYSKKKEILNSSKFCPIEDFNKLKLIVEELQTKINNLEQWKNSIKNNDIEKKEETINISKENEIKEVKDIKENIIKELNENNNNNIKNNLTINNIPKYIKKNIEEDKLQKIKNNFDADNSYSDDSNGYSNARTEQYNHISKNLKAKPKKKIAKKELSLKVKRIPSKTKEAKSISNSNNNTIETNAIKTKIPFASINPYINMTSNNISSNTKEKPKHKNQKFNSKILTNLEGLDLIARGLVKDDIDSLRNLRVGYKLIYRASEHGGKAEDFHERCDDFEGTLIIIKTKDENIFGGYTSVSWDPEDGGEKRDENAFVFSINLEKIYFYFGRKNNIICDKNKGPCFVGMIDINNNILKSKGFVNNGNVQCFEGENDKYEINGGKNEFAIDELEVFQVIVKTN